MMQLKLSKCSQTTEIINSKEEHIIAKQSIADTRRRKRFPKDQSPIQTLQQNQRPIQHLDNQNLTRHPCSILSIFNGGNRSNSTKFLLLFKEELSIQLCHFSIRNIWSQVQSRRLIKSHAYPSFFSWKNNQSKLISFI